MIIVWVLTQKVNMFSVLGVKGVFYFLKNSVVTETNILSCVVSYAASTLSYLWLVFVAHKVNQIKLIRKLDSLTPCEN